MGGMIKLSISVVCYQTPSHFLDSLAESLVLAINTLFLHRPNSQISLYFIDNSRDTRDSSNVCRHIRHRLVDQNISVELVSGHGNIGYGRAHNLIIDKIDSDYHLVLNPDVTLEHDALHKALVTISLKSNTKILSPFVASPTGEKQFLCKSYPSVLILLIRGLSLPKLRSIFHRRLSQYEMHDLSESEPTECPMLLSGCFMLFDSEVFKAVEGFDEKYFLYFEDFDLSLRISKFGTLVYDPQVIITHAGGNTGSKGLWHVFRFLESGFKFFNTHGWQWF